MTTAMEILVKLEMIRTKERVRDNATRHVTKHWEEGRITEIYIYFLNTVSPQHTRLIRSEGFRAS
jgi:hypothetical protein